MESIHHVSGTNCFGGNNSPTALGLLLFLDVRAFLLLVITEIKDTTEIRPEFQMELSDYAGDAKITLPLSSLYSRKCTQQIS